MSNATILLVEDDPEIARIICDHLRKNNFQITWATTGHEGLEDFKKDDYDLALIDLMLPELDGITLIRSLRNVSDIPLLIISAKAEEQEKIEGLKVGADDYITKPFSLDELLARIDSQLRRFRRYQNKEVQILTTEYVGGLKVDFENELVYLKSSRISLTAKEKGIFFLLAKNPFKTFSKSEIYEQVWFEQELDGGKTVTVHLKSLRTKLKETSRAPKFIETEWGIGYQFIGVEKR
ncbi:response regulator transcription factor [Alkalihalobacillus trypoxylicola]|uniref:Two-component system response regulator n=1 Tax=Alkalihalobacillus trypoxylicola TaxID=519424 RepID=A0A162CXQ3_9BACI|nr:response regulator transcription factor [Alkalihalobacillus trypoxylicola]KYG27059.1 two-component system response regulator [Alkalihalobacillus trypoxylicola]